MNEEKIVISYGLVEDLINMPENIRYAKALDDIKKELSSLSTSRGAGNNSGFVFEAMDAANQNILFKRQGKREIAKVINDNGLADVRILDTNGNIILEQQMKLGYHGTSKYQIDWEKYKGMEIVVDKGNEELAAIARQHRLKVRYSNVSMRSANRLSKAMSVEGKIRVKLGMKDNAPITSNLFEAAHQLRSADKSGKKSAKSSAAFAAGLSFGKNTYSMIEGNIELRDFLIDTGRDVAVAAGTGYVVGATGSLVSSVIVKVIVKLGIDFTQVKIGPIAAIMPTTAASMFLMGMAIGTGYSICKTIAENKKMYKKRINELNTVLNQALTSMNTAYNSLSQEIRETVGLWDRSIDQGFRILLDGIEQNDFDRFTNGLDTILAPLNSCVLFHTMDDFNEFFDNGESLVF